MGAGGRGQQRERKARSAEVGQEVPTVVQQVALEPWTRGGVGRVVRNSLNSGFIFNDEPTSVFVERLAVEWGSQMGVQESSMLPGGCFS